MVEVKFVLWVKAILLHTETTGTLPLLSQIRPYVVVFDTLLTVIRIRS